MSTKNFTTPEEFITYYVDALKEELGVFDLSTNKVGFLGFFMNILGNLNFDNKQYVQSLFKEAFVATAQEDKNLIFHGSTYGYMPTFATPSTAVGTFNLDFSNLPQPANTVAKRIVKFNPLGDPIEFTTNNTHYLTTATYSYVYESGSYNSQIRSESGEMEIIPSASTTVRAPFRDVRQYKKKESYIILPNYPWGSYHEHVFSTEGGEYISDIRVHLLHEGHGISDMTFDLVKIHGTEYDVKYVKYFESSSSQSVFFRRISDSKYILEFGNGIRGTWTPNAEIAIEVFTTVGIEGDIGQSAVGELVAPTQIQVFDYHTGVIIPTILIYDPNNFIETEISYSNGGKDPLSGDALRTEIVNYIQSRDYMMSEDDFYNVASKYLTDFKFLFKKIVPYENTFYLLRSFRDKYQEIVPSTNESVLTFNKTKTPIDDFTTVTFTELTTGGQLLDGVGYEYHLYAFDAFGTTIAYSGNPIIHTMGANGNTGRMRFEINDAPADPVPNAVKFRLYMGEVGNVCRYYETDNTGATPELMYDNGVTWEVGYPALEISSGVIAPTTTAWNSTTPYVISAGTGSLPAGEYTYKIISIDGVGTPIEATEDIIVSVPSDNSDITLNWEATSPVPTGLTEYLVYGRSSTFERFWRVSPPIVTYSDDGLEFEGSTPGSPFDTNDHYIVNNTYDINGTDYISPFFYKYNNTFQWFDGFLVNMSLFQYFAETEVYPSAESTVTAPSLFINLIYDDDWRRTTIFIKSHKDISDWNFRLTIPGHNIENIPMTIVDTNTFRYVYTLNNGLFVDEIEVEIDGYDGSDAIFKMSSNSFIQVRDFNDILKIPRYWYTPPLAASPQALALNVPVMNKSVFETDDDYYLEKMRDFVEGLNIQENRMVSDNIQFRFLNTSWMPPFVVGASFKDGHSFLNVSYLTQANTGIHNTPPVSPGNGDRCVIGSTGTGVFSGHDNEIAIAAGGIWTTFETPAINDVIHIADLYENYIWNGSTWDLLGVTLPFKIEVTIKSNRENILSSNINVLDEKDAIELQVSIQLQQQFTGTDVEFYDTKIIDHVRNGREAWIKDIDVIAMDANNIPVLDGIETLTYEEVMEALSHNKYQAAIYTPPFIFWDVNNVEIILQVD